MNRSWMQRSAGVLMLVLGLTTVVAAQQATPEPPEGQTAAPASSNPFEHIRFGVALEGFYQYNWNRPYDRINLLRAYDTRANVFGIQQAAIVVESAPGGRQGPPLRRPRRPAVRPGDGDRAGQRRQRAAARRLSQHLAGLRHLRVPGRPRAADRLRQVRLESRLRDQLREGQQPVLARVPVQLPAVLPLRPARERFRSATR